ncbi:MAG: hypothetical protein AAF235_06945 [Planctomycetota bacterium]
MATGRNPQPLFELLRTQPTREPPPHAPSGRQTEPKSESETTAPKGRTSSQRGKDGNDDTSNEREAAPSHRRVAIPVPTIYAAGAFCIVLAAVAWLVGFQMGQSEAEPSGPGNGASGLSEAIAPVFGSTDLGDEEDQDDDASTRSGDRTSGTTALGENGIGGTSGAVVNGPAVRYFDINGPLDSDPRRPGTNYLELAVLPEASAREGLEALRAGDVRAAAVLADPAAGVDSRRRATNTSSRYLLIGLDVAIPSGQFRASASERRAYQRLVGQLGRRWAESGGASDFSATNWARYDGP